MREMVAALDAAELTVYHYSDDARRIMREDDECGSRITEIYDCLKKARGLVIVASQDYFALPNLAKKSNLYCPEELVETVVAWR